MSPIWATLGIVKNLGSKLVPNSGNVPNLTLKLLIHPKYRGTDIDNDKNTSGPITNGDHGEANEYEGDSHDEDNDEKDGVGVFFPHIFLHSFSLLAFL